MATAFDAAVAQCVGVLAESFGKTASKTMIDGYRMGLSGLTAEHVKLATATALQKCKFMPSAAELRELAGVVRVEDRAEIAWIAFDKAITEHSVYKTICFDDAVINAVVRSLGGVAVIVEMSDEQYQFLRARFLKAYVAIARAGVGAEGASPLLGYFDQVNGTNGKHVVLVKTGLPALPNMPAIEFTNNENNRPSELLRLKKA